MMFTRANVINSAPSSTVKDIYQPPKQSAGNLGNKCSVGSHPFVALIDNQCSIYKYFSHPGTHGSPLVGAELGLGEGGTGINGSRIDSLENGQVCIVPGSDLPLGREVKPLGGVFRDALEHSLREAPLKNFGQKKRGEQFHAGESGRRLEK